MGKRFILKVFSGPHVGAEILLSRGKMLVGRGDQCDIILYDSAISSKHVELIISDEEIQVSSIDQPIYIEGKTLKEKIAKVNAYQFITIGTTHFSIGINGEDWPKITIPKLDFLSKETDKNNDASLAPVPDTSIKALSFSGIKEIFTKYLIGSKYSKLSASLGLALTTGAAVAASVVFNGATPNNQQTAFASLSGNGIFQEQIPSKKKDEITPEEITVIQQKIAKIKLSDIEIKQKNNKLLVQGTVVSSKQKKQLEKLLKPYILAIQEQDVYIKEELISSAKIIVSELDLDGLAFSIKKPHTLTIKGYIEDEGSWLQARDILKNDLAGIRKIDDEEVETQNHRIEELEKLLEEQELLPLVDIQSSAGQVLAMAELTHENAQRWETIAYTFKQRYGKHPLLKEKIVLLEMNPNDFDIQIRGIVTTGNDKNVVLTASGSYGVGEQFSNGFTIKAIEPKKIVLSRNHQSIDLPIYNPEPAEKPTNTKPTKKL
jgi:type III secretion system YscD/HrpQ family protein